MKYILFSIIVPVYNVDQYLGVCIESVLNQYFSSFEIILVDDGSTDTSGLICDKLANRYNEIKVVHQKNAGLSAARNTGIKHSQGEYLIFLDSDDLLYEKSLCNLALAIREQAYPDFMISRRCTIQEGKLIPCKYYFTKLIISANSAEQIYQSLQHFSDCWLGVWIFSAKKEYCVNKKLLFYDGILHEDEEWVPRLFFNTDHIGFNNEILYCNRVDREGSITATLNIKRKFDKLKILDLLCDEFQKSQYSDEVRGFIRQRIQQLFFGTLCDAYLYRKNKQYGTLLESISKHTFYMKSAKRLIYKIVYQSISFLGVSFTCRLLAKVNSLKRGLQ